jgi:hypothetical protein
LSAAKCETGWGDGLSTSSTVQGERPSPHPAAPFSRVDPPPPGEGKRGTRLRLLAACFARALLSIFLALPSEGAGNAGCTLHPRSRVQNCAKKRTRAYRFSGGIRHSLRNGFTAYNVLSPVTGLFCHRHPRKMLPANLMPASGHQDHTPSPSARKAPSSLAPLASTASCPASVTISSRPSVGQDGSGYKVIWVFGKSEYFCKGGWTEGSMNCAGDLPVGWQVRRCGRN